MLLALVAADSRSASAILDDFIRDVPKWYDFEFDESHVSVISGKEEGMYAWISLNYMLGRFSQESHRKREYLLIISHRSTTLLGGFISLVREFSSYISFAGLCISLTL